MSFRNPNSSQGSDDFHGLKDSISEADFTAESIEDKNKRKETKKFLFKKDSKDKGYSTLASDTNQDSVFLVNTKSNKKTKADNKIATLNVFKKSFKDDKHDKRIKDPKETKEEVKRSKKSKERSSESSVFYDKESKENLFGNYLENAVKSFASNDGVRMPAPIRICIDIIEQKGIDSEHIYRRSINKSQLESICEFINNDRIEAKLEELNAEPNLACAIIKKFLRELKAPLISDDILNFLDKCDSAISDKDVTTKVEFLKKQISKLPQPNYDTFSYLLMHFHRVFTKSESNKIEIGIFVQKFQPMLRIRERLFKFLIIYADLIFSDSRFKKYRIKASDETMSRFSLLPDNIDELEQEISRQEVYLAKLHSRIANEESSNDKALQEQLCDELWSLQRYVTSLKRKVKKLKLERKNLETQQLNSIKEMTSQSQTNSNNSIQGTSSNSTISSSNNNLPAKNETQANETISDDQSAQPVCEDSANSSNIQQQTTQSNTTNIDDQTQIDQLYGKELNLISENCVLIETLEQILEKINKEKTLINNAQQKLKNHIGNSNMQCPIPDTSMLSLQELHDSEQLIINENKLLEERINLINKRINVEKEKIFELKLSIYLKTNLSSEQQAFLLLLKTNPLTVVPIDSQIVSNNNNNNSNNSNTNNNSNNNSNSNSNSNNNNNKTNLPEKELIMTKL